METGDYSSFYSETGRTILKQLAAGRPGQNIVFSPCSILMLLGVCAASSAGASRDEILRAVAGDASFGALQDALAQLRSDLTESGTLLSSTAVCVRRDIRDRVPARYEAMLDVVYGGRIFTGENVAETVNAWVRENTLGMIDGIADDSMRNMPACLLNAAAFEAEWESAYRTDQIRKDRFTNADGSVTQAEMLNSKESRYVENGAYTGFVKPYKGREFSYMALLPREAGAEALTGALASLDFPGLFRSAERTDVLVTMPEFRYSFSQDLTPLCGGMGIRTAFSANADFSPLSDVPLTIGSVLHRAFIQVDRKGTRAAAVTAALMLRSSARPRSPRVVRLDRPFVFAVVHNETGLPVFCGVVHQL